MAYKLEWLYPCVPAWLQNQAGEAFIVWERYAGRLAVVKSRAPA